MNLKTKIVEILVGEYSGQKAYVTYEQESENYLRVTPVDGDPLTSVELNYQEVKFIEEGVQLEIDGIGQQKATFSDWKNENEIYTHNSEHLDKEDWPWSAWAETESPVYFGEKWGFESMGHGETEKMAIIDFCRKHEIELPFWW